MADFKCKVCGGNVTQESGAAIGVCSACNTTMTLSVENDDKLVSLFNRGNHFRRMKEFDKALNAYRSILKENNGNAEALWCKLLCRYGIEYVKESDTNGYVPIFNKTPKESILEDADYKKAYAGSEGKAKELYKEEAEKLAALQKEILAIAASEKPYDIFICCDESGDTSSAEEIFNKLKSEGYRVFFPKIILKDVHVQKKEGYIYGAVAGAKVLIVVGVKRDDFYAASSRNNWVRFHTFDEGDTSRIILPCYRDMDEYDIPDDMADMSAINMSDGDFNERLSAELKKILGASKESLAKLEEIKQTDDLDEDDYTSETYRALLDALAMPEVTNNDVLIKIGAINAAKKALVFSGLEDLEAVKAQVSSLTGSDYTSDSWADVGAALSMAEDTNSKIQIKTIAINISLKGLEFAGKAELDSAKQNAEGKIEDIYTVESWKPFEAAVNMPETTNAEVIAKAKALNSALAQLEEAGNPEYDAAMRTIEGLNQADFTPESWIPLKEALNLPEKGRQQLADKGNALIAALEGLVFASQAGLDKIIAKIDDLDIADYTASSRGALLEAIDLPESTNQEVAAKTKALKKAVASLEYGKLIVIQGKPNVGKSSLLNAISETDEAIVTDIPGTTRDILRQTVEIDGFTVTLLDTAGIRETYNQIEKIGVERAYKAARSADMVLLVIDGSTELTKDDVSLLENLRTDSLILLNKSDLGLAIPREHFEQYAQRDRIVEVSAVSGDGLIDLYIRIGKMFREQEAAGGQAVKAPPKPQKPRVTVNLKEPPKDAKAADGAKEKAETARREMEAAKSEEAKAAAARAAEERKALEEAKAAEDAKKSAETKAAEEAKKAAEEAKKAEEARRVAEAAKKAAEAKAAEEERLAAKEAQLAAEAKAAEEARIAAEARAAEENRKAAEAKAAAEAKHAEEKKIAEAAHAKAAEEAKRAEEARAAMESAAAKSKAADEARISAEAARAKAAEEAKRAAIKAAEEAKAAAAKAAEEAKAAAAAKAAEEAKKAADAKAAEEAQRVADVRAAAAKNQPERKKRLTDEEKKKLDEEYTALMKDLNEKKAAAEKKLKGPKYLLNKAKFDRELEDIYEEIRQVRVKYGK